MTVTANSVTTVEPKLKVKKGLVTIKLGENAEGAAVTLVSGDERRPIPSDRFKDKALAVDLEASKPYSIVAEKKGFAPYEKKIDFEDGQAEKTFVVNLMLPRGDSDRDSDRRSPPVRHGGGSVAVASPSRWRKDRRCSAATASCVTGRARSAGSPKRPTCAIRTRSAAPRRSS